MSYRAWSDTVPSKQTNTTSTAPILLVVVRAQQKPPASDTHGEAAAAWERKGIKNIWHEHRTSRLACTLLTEYSMVPLGLWNDMRLPSFFSGVFFWPVSVSKRGKVRITFMFLSPQLVISCCFPAPWVGSSFVNSERASQPASDVSCKRRTTFSLSLPLSLLFPSLCVALLLPSCSLSLSITLFSPRSHSPSPSLSLPSSS